jgi:hypothetical protein
MSEQMAIEAGRCDARENLKGLRGFGLGQRKLVNGIVASKVVDNK